MSGASLSAGFIAPSIEVEAISAVGPLLGFVTVAVTLKRQSPYRV
jgi:hypothetical protein